MFKGVKYFAEVLSSDNRLHLLSKGKEELVHSRPLADARSFVDGNLLIRVAINHIEHDSQVNRFESPGMRE